MSQAFLFSIFSPSESRRKEQMWDRARSPDDQPCISTVWSLWNLVWSPLIFVFHSPREARNPADLFSFYFAGALSFFSCFILPAFWHCVFIREAEILIGAVFVPAFTPIRSPSYAAFMWQDFMPQFRRQSSTFRYMLVKMTNKDIICCRWFT